MLGIKPAEEVIFWLSFKVYFQRWCLYIEKQNRLSYDVLRFKKPFPSKKKYWIKIGESRENVMIALIQRVKSGRVLVENKIYSQIGKGYVILVGFCCGDNEKIVEKMAEKIANLRIMADKEGKMNLNLSQVGGEILLVSQFTLCADTSQRRPSFIKAMEGEEAKKLYQFLIKKLQEKNLSVKTGKFGCYMEVEIVNDGPVTIILESKHIV